MSSVTCHLSPTPTATATGPTHANSPTMHNGLVQQDRNKKSDKNFTQSLIARSYLFPFVEEKSRIQETKHLSTNADSSTNTKKILLVRQNSSTKKLLLRVNLTTFISKSFQIWDHFLPLFFPKDSKNLKSLDIGLWKVGAK